MNNISIIGYSGHSYEIIEILRKDNFFIKGYFELEKKELNPFSLDYLGSDKHNKFVNLIKGNHFFVAIGNNSIRLKLSKVIQNNGGILANAIHNTASISNHLKIGQGNFISKNVSLNFNCILKDHIIINTAAVVEHDCTIESGVHIGPSVVLCGGVTVNKGAFIGANSVVKEKIVIGKNAIIGAGSVVIQNISENAIVYGNPARKANE